MSYEIKINQFEGPFDLLLFFIKRDELDIYDIPISQITNDFLEYINQMEKMNIDVASEFILMASTLMRIKSKMLLPRPRLNDEGEEIDPRENLVKQLALYKMYKNIVPLLSSLEDNYTQRHKRGNAKDTIKKITKSANIEVEMQNIDLFMILKMYKKTLAKMKKKEKETTHNIIPFPFTVEEQKKIITSLVNDKKKVSFQQIITLAKEKTQVIFNFLAILELLQYGEISITVGQGYNNFWIEKIKA